MTQPASLPALLRLTLLLSHALVLLGGAVLGHFFWPDEPAQVLSAPPAVAEASLPPSPVPVPEPPASEAPPPAETAATEPELQLRGVFVAAVPERSLALIADAAGQQRVYRVGQKLAEDYTLQSIAAKEVVLEKNGDTRSLPLTRAGPDVAGVEALAEIAALPAAPEVRTEPPAEAEAGLTPPAPAGPPPGTAP